MKKSLKEIFQERWVRRNGEVDQSMVEFCLKNNTYLDMGTFYLDLGRSKPTIEKDLYYSDEDSSGNYRSAPDINKNIFLNYSMRMNSNRDYIKQLEEEEKDLIFTTQNDYIKAWTVRTYNYREREGYIVATPEQKKLVIAELKKSDSKFLTRLERYYKRYGKHIFAHTYWANR